MTSQELNALGSGDHDFGDGLFLRVGKGMNRCGQWRFHGQLGGKRYESPMAAANQISLSEAKAWIEEVKSLLTTVDERGPSLAALNWAECLTRRSGFERRMKSTPFVKVVHYVSWALRRQEDIESENRRRKRDEYYFQKIPDGLFSFEEFRRVYRDARKNHGDYWRAAVLCRAIKQEGRKKKNGWEK